MRLPCHEATTAQLGAAYPFVSSRPLPTSAVLVGRDLLGSYFLHDPFELYANGVLTNPNMIVLGQLGRGKSAFVKSYLFRQAVFGRRIIVLDPKGEYGMLARALGTEPLALRPGGTLRLNPLDVVGAGHLGREDLTRRRLAALTAVASAIASRELRPHEHSCLGLALRQASECRVVTLKEVVSALLFPREDAARSVNASTVTVAAEGREIAFELDRLVSGELSQMFDGPTSPSIDLTSQSVVVDLSALNNSPALGALLALCAASLEGSWRDGGAKTVLVIDEAWAVLSNIGAARFFQSSFKLARSNGVANVAVVHRTSDLLASGSLGSVTERLAQGLLSDCETVVCFAQAQSELRATAELLGLSDEEARLVSGLPRGVALWRVAGRSYLVEHRLSAAERRLVDTDGALASNEGPR